MHRIFLTLKSQKIVFFGTLKSRVATHLVLILTGGNPFSIVGRKSLQPLTVLDLCRKQDANVVLHHQCLVGNRVHVLHPVDAVLLAQCSG